MKPVATFITYVISALALVQPCFAFCYWDDTSPIELNLDTEESITRFLTGELFGSYDHAGNFTSGFACDRYEDIDYDAVLFRNIDTSKGQLEYLDNKVEPQEWKPAIELLQAFRPTALLRWVPNSNEPQTLNPAFEVIAFKKDPDLPLVFENYEIGPITKHVILNINKSPYAQWAMNTFGGLGSSFQAAKEDDADSDELSNYMEFLLRTDPRAFNQIDARQVRGSSDTSLNGCGADETERVPSSWI